jgi:hypothetical protein
MRHHGRLSNAWWRQTVFLGGVARVHYAALDVFSHECVLRNGPRILRACATMAARP